MVFGMIVMATAAFTGRKKAFLFSLLYFREHVQTATGINSTFMVEIFKVANAFGTHSAMAFNVLVYLHVDPELPVLTTT